MTNTIVITSEDIKPIPTRARRAIFKADVDGYKRYYGGTTQVERNEREKDGPVRPSRRKTDVLSSSKNKQIH